MHTNAFSMLQFTVCNILLLLAIYLGNVCRMWGICATVIS